MHHTNYLSETDTEQQHGAKSRDWQNELISVIGTDKAYMQTKGTKGMQGKQVNLLVTIE